MPHWYVALNGTYYSNVNEEEEGKTIYFILTLTANQNNSIKTLKGKRDYLKLSLCQRP